MASLAVPDIEDEGHQLIRPVIDGHHAGRSAENAGLEKGLVCAEGQSLCRKTSPLIFEGDPVAIACDEGGTGFLGNRRRSTLLPFSPIPLELTALASLGPFFGQSVAFALRLAFCAAFTALWSRDAFGPLLSSLSGVSDRFESSIAKVEEPVIPGHPSSWTIWAGRHPRIMLLLTHN